MIKKIAIVGPESTGKSTLSQMLADHYQTTWVPEYARTYLEQMDQTYQQEDLLDIAKGQMELEDKLEKEANRVLFCDTNLWVIKIWSEYKYGSCNPWILDQIRQRKYDLHLLTYIDIPWQDDPLREHPDKRQDLFNLYQRELVQSNTNFKIIRGNYQHRLSQAIRIIENI